MARRRRRPLSTLTEMGQARRLRPLAVEALGSYDLEWSGLRLISNSWNCVLRVDTAAGPLALRVTRPPPPEAQRSVRSEAEFMQALAEATDIAVPAVIPNREGQLVTVAAVQDVPEARSCVLFDWLGGHDLAASVRTSHWVALGELMGAMHRFAAGWTPPPRFEVSGYDSVLPYGDRLVLFEGGPVDLFGLAGLLEEAYAATQARIARSARDRRRIVVHGDLHGWNVKIRRGVLSPFDFEDFLLAAPVLDVATSLWYVRDRPDYRELATAFRAGYQRQQPWVEHEPGEVDYMMTARALDLLNTVAQDPGLDVGDLEAFVRRREPIARIAVGADQPITL